MLLLCQGSTTNGTRITGRDGTGPRVECAPARGRVVGAGSGRGERRRRRPAGRTSSSHHRRLGGARAGNYWAIECGRARTRVCPCPADLFLAAFAAGPGPCLSAHVARRHGPRPAAFSYCHTVRVRHVVRTVRLRMSELGLRWYCWQCTHSGSLHCTRVSCGVQ
jgi:hypothetical protein